MATGVWAASGAGTDRFTATRACSHHVFGPWPGLSIRETRRCSAFQRLPGSSAHLPHAPYSACSCMCMYVQGRNRGDCKCHRLLQPYRKCRSMFLVKKRKASARSTKDDAVCLAKKLPFLAALTPASVPGQRQFSTVLVQVQVQVQAGTGPCSLASERPSHFVSFERPPWFIQESTCDWTRLG